MVFIIKFMNKITNILFNNKNETFILSVIFLNSIIIYLQECDIRNLLIDTIDVICTIIFTIEMIVKQKEYGFTNYWKNGWNIMDGILVIVSFPSIFLFFTKLEIINFSYLLIIRLLRVLRFFRLFRLFPRFKEITRGFFRAIKQSFGVFIGFFILILISSMISCSLFKDIAPEYFDTPTNAIYSIFRLFTIEGWYDIPDYIAEQLPTFWGRLTRLYFCILVIIGGIIGISLVNSIFVDAMVSDNNDDIKEKLNILEEKINELLNSKNKI